MTRLYNTLTVFESEILLQLTHETNRPRQAIFVSARCHTRTFAARCSLAWYTYVYIATGPSSRGVAKPSSYVPSQKLRVAMNALCDDV